MQEIDIQNDIETKQAESPMPLGQYIAAGLVTACGVLFMIGTGPTAHAPTAEEIHRQKAERAFAAIDLEALAVYVWDSATEKELFSKNPYDQLPLASLTKVMTAVTALSIVPDYAVVNIERAFLNEEGDSGLYAQEKWKLKDLLYFTLMQSSNDGAHAIASVAGALKGGTEELKIGRKAFIAEMNKKAAELGLAQTYFLNETGLDMTERTSGSYGSARDVALLFSYAVKQHRDMLEPTTRSEWLIQSLSDLPHPARNTNNRVNEIPGLIGSKTGYTDLAGGNVVISFEIEPGHPIVVSILGSSSEGRFEDAKKLVWATIEYLRDMEPAVQS